MRLVFPASMLAVLERVRAHGHATDGVALELEVKVRVLVKVLGEAA